MCLQPCRCAECLPPFSAGATWLERVVPVISTNLHHVDGSDTAETRIFFNYPDNCP